QMTYPEKRPCGESDYRFAVDQVWQNTSKQGYLARLKAIEIVTSELLDIIKDKSQVKKYDAAVNGVVKFQNTVAARKEKAATLKLERKAKREGDAVDSEAAAYLASLKKPGLRLKAQQLSPRAG